VRRHFTGILIIYGSPWKRCKAGEASRGPWQLNALRAGAGFLKMESKVVSGAQEASSTGEGI
jgi:hypothetical protein